MLARKRNDFSGEGYPERCQIHTHGNLRDDSTGVDEEGSRSFLPVSLSGTLAKNVCLDIKSLMRIGSPIIAAGGSIDETLLHQHITTKDGKSLPLEAIRRLHNYSKGRTRLNLVRGIWVLCPSKGDAACQRFACPERLVCMGRHR